MKAIRMQFCRLHPDLLILSLELEIQLKASGLESSNCLLGLQVVDFFVWEFQTVSYLNHL